MSAPRSFSTGAVRDTEDGKVDYEGFVSPAVLEVYGRYMMKHQTLADGSRRASDNWQNGMPTSVYMKSLLRHVVDAWLIHRGREARESLMEALCGVLFNAMGYMHALVCAGNTSGTARPLAVDDADAPTKVHVTDFTMNTQALWPKTRRRFLPVEQER